MIDTTDGNDTSSLMTSKKIKKYLQKNPNFFHDNPSVLELLNLPHASGEAVSLIERQIALLRTKNLELSKHIKDLLVTAENNVKLFEKTSRLVSSLVVSKDLESIILTLSKSLKVDFQIEFHRLILFGEHDVKLSANTQIISIKYAKKEVGSLLKSNKPLSGILTNKELNFLFGNEGAKVQSAAAANLSNGSLFGILAIGNSDPNYYNSIMDTIFFSHITEVLNGLMPIMLPDT